MRRRHEAARQGWVLFNDSHPAPTREVINTQLESMGFEGIAPRTYKHYGALARHGLRKYLPINEFDIARKRGELGEAN